MGKAGLTLGPIAVVIAKNRLEHVLARHAANTLAQNVGKFAAGMERQQIEGLINAALSDASTMITPGTKVTFYDLDFGVHIGTNQAGQATTAIRVLVDNVTKQPITGYPK